MGGLLRWRRTTRSWRRCWPSAAGMRDLSASAPSSRILSGDALSSGWCALQRKSYLCIPLLGIARPPSQFPHSCVCERFIYSQDPSCSITARSTVGNVNPSQTHECGNWDCGRAIPFLGIFFSNFRYWFFAVREEKACKVRYIDFHDFLGKWMRSKRC